DAEAERPDHLVILAVVLRLRRVAERLVFGTAMDVPSAEARRAAERDGEDSRHAEEAELVVDPPGGRGQLVVAAEAHAELHRKRHGALLAREARRGAELEILPCSAAAVGLTGSRRVIGIQLERRERVRLPRPRPEERSVVDAELERDLLDRGEAVIRA